jgi:hypothetical protein
MNWYKVTLSHDDISARKHMALQNAFIEIFTANRGPGDAGMYQSLEFGVHEYLFPPGAARIALPLIVSYGGVPCPAPTRAEVKPLAVDSANEDCPFRNPST